MFGNDLHGLPAVYSFQDGYVAPQLLQNAPQCLSDQGAISNHQDFHPAWTFRLEVF